MNKDTVTIRTGVITKPENVIRNSVSAKHAGTNFTNTKILFGKIDHSVLIIGKSDSQLDFLISKSIYSGK